MNCSIDEVGAWASHPGGRKVIGAIIATLGLPYDALELAWRPLSEVGDLARGRLHTEVAELLDRTIKDE